MPFDFTPITIFQVEGEVSKETRSSMFEAEGKGMDAFNPTIIRLVEVFLIY